jgi:hypothetical protein
MLKYINFLYTIALDLIQHINLLNSAKIRRLSYSYYYFIQAIFFNYLMCFLCI